MSMSNDDDHVVVPDDALVDALVADTKEPCTLCLDRPVFNGVVDDGDPVTCPRCNGYHRVADTKEEDRG